MNDTTTPAGLLDVGRTQAEFLDLSGGYVVENRAASSGGANIKTTSSGTATGIFAGGDGIYDVTVGYLNEDDGVSRWSLELNGATVATWDGSGGANGLETVSRTLELSQGDVITLTGRHGTYEYARLDWLEIEEAGSGPGSQPDPDPEPASDPHGEGTAIGVGLTEAEALDLSGGYTVEGRGASSGGANIKTTSSGTATGIFAGADGKYDVTVGYLNEDDGASRWSIEVNGETVASWDGTGGANSLETASVTVDLSEGDTITLTGRHGTYEYARLDWLRIEAAGSGPAPQPEPQPEPAPEPVAEGTAVGIGRTEAEVLDLSGGYTVEDRGASSGGANLKTTSSGTASGVFTGADGSYDVTVGYFNENDGVAQWSLRVNGEMVASWDGSGGANELERETVTLDLSEGDTISLTGRSGGGEFGRIDWLEIDAAGKTPAPTPEPEPAPTSPADHDLFAFIGQSNANGHFFRRPGDSSGGALGNDIFEAELVSRLGGTATAINASTSGSGSNEHADGQEYWWDLEDDRPGPSLVRAMNAIDAAESSGKDIDALIWAQGEDDALAITDDGANFGVTVERLKTATERVFEHIRSALDDPDLPIFIQEVGDFPEDGGWLDGPYGTLDAVREAQAEIISGMDNVYLGARTTDVSDHYDTIHFNNAGYGTIARRLADTIANGFDGDIFA